MRNALRLRRTRACWCCVVAVLGGAPPGSRWRGPTDEFGAGHRAVLVALGAGRCPATPLTALRRPADRRPGRCAARCGSLRAAVAAGDPGAAAAAAVRSRSCSSTPRCGRSPAPRRRRAVADGAAVRRARGRLPAGAAARGGRPRRRRGRRRRCWSQACRGHAARGRRPRAGRATRTPTRRRTPRSRGFEKANLILVLLIAQAVQVLLLVAGGLRVLRASSASVDHGPRR